MKQEDFKLQLVQDIAEIKSDIKHIKKNMPVCEKEIQNEKIRVNSRIVWLILVTYIPMLVGIYFIIK